MRQRIGIIKALFRYPVKSMAAEPLTTATLGASGLEGDRRFAFARHGDGSDFPWLTAGKLPSLVLYRPYRSNGAEGALPDYVETPGGEKLPLHGEELRRELGARHGTDVQLRQLKHGMFDEAPLSLITVATINAIGQAAGMTLEARRFRPNILIDTDSPTAFTENAWPGSIVSFGEGPAGSMVGVMMKDIRCGMLNLDPDTAAVAPEVLRVTVRDNQNCAGAYGFTLAAGVISVGDAVYLRKGEE